MSISTTPEITPKINLSSTASFNDALIKELDRLIELDRKPRKNEV